MTGPVNNSDPSIFTRIADFFRPAPPTPPAPAPEAAPENTEINTTDRSSVSGNVGGSDNDPIAEEVINRFKRYEGKKVGESSYPFGLGRSDIRLGKLEGVYHSESEAIRAARVDDGMEIIFEQGGNHGVFHAQEFDGLGKTVKVDGRTRGFTAVDEDNVAEQHFQRTGNAEDAIVAANHELHPQSSQPQLHRYTHQGETETNLSGLV